MVHPRFQRQFNHQNDDDRLNNTTIKYNNIDNGGEEENIKHMDQMAQTAQKTNNHDTHDKHTFALMKAQMQDHKYVSKHE